MGSARRACRVLQLQSKDVGTDKCGLSEKSGSAEVSYGIETFTSSWRGFFFKALLSELKLMNVSFFFYVNVLMMFQ